VIGGPEAEAAIETVAVVTLFARTALSKCSAKLQAKVALSQRAFHFNRFRCKRARGGQGPGP
jgi:hypothetical protein